MRHSKDFLELFDSIHDENFKNHMKNDTSGILTLKVSDYDISNIIRRCPVCSAVFLDYINFQNHVRRCRNWMRDAPPVRCLC